MIAVLVFGCIGLAMHSIQPNRLPNDPSCPRTVQVCIAKWKAKYVVAKSVMDSCDRFEYYFSSDGNDLRSIFSSAADCLEALDGYPLDTVQGFREVNAFVRITFPDSSIVSLHFDEHGGYYHRGQWHHRNDAMYHAIFQYFSDELVPPAILKIARDGAENSR
jgi:hypothetical protein